MAHTDLSCVNSRENKAHQGALDTDQPTLPGVKLTPMQLPKRPLFPLVLTLAAAAVTTGCDQSYDAVNASTPTRTLDLGLDDPAYYVSLGHELRISKRYEDAIAAYRRAIQLDLDSAEAYDGLGNVLAEQRRMEEAIAAYRRSIQVDPKNANAYSGLGNALAQQKRLEEAIAAYRRAIKADPDQMLAYTGLGNVLTEQKKYSEAIATYEKALNAPEKTETAHTLALVGLGRALQAQGNRDDAIALYQKATEISPDYAWTYIYLGHALAAQNRFDEANASYQQVLKLPIDRKRRVGNSHAIAHNGLGTVLQRQGKMKAAIGQFEQAVQLDLSYELAHNNLKRAKQLLAEQSKPSVVSKQG